MNEITTLPIDALNPNSYNPNEMTDEEFAECLAEVRYLGRLPKPVIVRPNGEGYTIVDGEHGWRCAKDAGITEIPCEVVEVDDFEAMRQTYKRNQHGTHNPVKLGQMFQQMKAERDLSKRALAKDIEVSEGTVRNAIEYAEARKVRNDYAVEELSVQQVRLLNRMPEGAIDFWLKCGAPVKALVYETKRDQRRAERDGKKAVFAYDTSEEDIAQSNADALVDLIDLGLFEYGQHGLYRYDQDTFRKAIQRARKWYWWLRNWTWRGVTMEQLIPYAKHHFIGVWYVRDQSYMGSVLKKIIQVTDDGAEFLLSPSGFDTVIDEQQKSGGSYLDFVARLDLAIYEATGVTAKKNNDSVKVGLIQAELAGAPDYIKESKLSDDHKLILWKLKPNEWHNEQLFQKAKEKMALDCGRLQVAEFQSDHHAVYWTLCNHYVMPEEKRYLSMQLPKREMAERIASRCPFYPRPIEPNDGLNIGLIDEHENAREQMTEHLMKLTRKELLYLEDVTESFGMHEVLKEMAKCL